MVEIILQIKHSVLTWDLSDVEDTVRTTVKYVGLQFQFNPASICRFLTHCHRFIMSTTALTNSMTALTKSMTALTKSMTALIKSYLVQ